jgi:pimeloyl-ACP methyl ester carboxylesterase
MKPALTELARDCRVISYSYSGDIGSREVTRGTHGFDNYLGQLDTILDHAGIAQAALCGISFGGFVALRYAATRPQRVTSLVLASSPAPGWEPNPQQSRWLSRPWLSAPAFVATSPLRVWPEVRSALPTWPARVGFFVEQGLRSARAPMVPSRMAERIRLAQQTDFRPDCARVQAPTLIVTGEAPLDRVVPVASTKSFCDLIPGAEASIFERTGHLGCLTQPSRFAHIVGQFVHAHNH